MDFEQYIKYLLTTPWQWAAHASLVAAIVFGFIVKLKPKWESKTKHLFWVIPLLVFLVGTFYSLFNNSYDIYEEARQELEETKQDLEETKQDLEEARQVYEIYEETRQELEETKQDLEEARQELKERRPNLVLEPMFADFAINEARQMVYINVDFKIENIGYSSAYHSRSRICVASLDTPEHLDAYDDIYETNPIHVGLKKYLLFITKDFINLVMVII